jgi:hypothetical protein
MIDDFGYIVAAFLFGLGAGMMLAMWMAKLR